jgi:threonine/homoserine/homoserine lactone efflux protein
MDTSFLAFVGISLVVIVTPGPDTAVTIRNALQGGARGGAFTALGVSAGQAIWALAASAGIAAILAASEAVFLAVKYLGAAYLVYLGLASLRNAFRAGARPADGGPAAKHLGAGAAFRHGLVSNLTNPKMAAFFGSMLPQFAPEAAAGGATAIGHYAALGLIFCTLTLLWLSLYACLVGRAGNWFRGPRIRRALEATMGAALVALGLRLAFERR